MGAFGACCCDCCLTSESVPVTTIAGMTGVGSWVQRSGGIPCCWSKWYNYTGSRPVSSSTKIVWHTRYDGDASWDYYGPDWNLYSCTINQCDYFVPIMNVRTQYKLEWWKRLKAEFTAVADPVTGNDVRITWSKVCGSVCDGESAADYWVVEYEQKFNVVVTQEDKYWDATNWWSQSLTAPCQGTICDESPIYNGRWFGGTYGGTYVTNSSGVPPQEDIWTFTRNLPIFNGTVTVKRYKSFSSIPTSATLFPIDTSEIIPGCKQTPCMTDTAIDGYSFGYGADYPIDANTLYTWTVVTSETEYWCQAFTAFCDGYVGYPDKVVNQYGETGPYSLTYLEKLLYNPCKPNVSNSAFLGCTFRKYTAFSNVTNCDIYGYGTFVVTPPASITVVAV